MARKGWKSKMHEVIFETDSPAGKLFDILLLIAIVLSVVVVMLESIPQYEKIYKYTFYEIEWFFTAIFTLEYIARIISIGKPKKYIFSFFGIIDLLAILPGYFSLFLAGTQSLTVIRSIRLIRIFRILKLAQFTKEGRNLMDAMKNSRHKIAMFLMVVLTLVIILGTLIYMIEDPKDGFTSIPASVYWAIVTLTTVGYGDITPVTGLGQFLSAIVMILGYSIIAVPTGIVTKELIAEHSTKNNTQSCPSCGAEGHDDDAVHCKYCGYKINS